MNGTRVACGVVEKVPATEQILKTTTKNLTSAGVSSTVLLYAVQPDTACYFGTAKNLEPNLVSFLNKNATLMGKNCNVTNGCGVHLHNGTSCFNTTTQGGHYYNKVKYPIDPWLYTMYDMTDRNGNGYFTGCVQTGFEVSRFLRRPFIIHSNNGTRVSCGLLTNPVPAPVIAPVPAPVKGAPDPAPSSNITAPVMAPSSNGTAPIVAPVISPTSNYTAPIKSPTSNDTAPVMAPVRAPYRSPVKAPVKKACGLFRLQLFCPLTGCGIFGRLLGLC
jgi:hypothetical protein